jgi:hypothetical protein
MEALCASSRRAHAGSPSASDAGTSTAGCRDSTKATASLSTRSPTDCSA